MNRFQKIFIKKIYSLKGLFTNDSNIVFAYLFGGLLKDKPNPLSDVDVAVYVKNTKKLNYLELFSNIANVLGTDEIDLVILNTAPLSLTRRILQNRKVLIDKNPFQRHRYESIILREFFDFTIKERDILKRRYGTGRLRKIQKGNS
ncbi:MAG: nucleotidyltransferase domain-containing protein [Nitrospirota bacterium]